MERQVDKQGNGLDGQTGRWIDKQMDGQQGRRDFNTAHKGRESTGQTDL